MSAVTTPGTTRRARRIVALALTTTALAAGGATAAGSAAQAATGAATTARSTPRSIRVPAKSLGGARAAVAAAAITPLRTFSSSFTSGGVTYPYTMVGTAPTGAATTTTVANTLTPLALKIGTRTMGVPASVVTSTTGSGIWTNKAFPGGTGQYTDVFLRTQFWSQLNNGAKAWHVKLAAPTVRPTLTLTVPAANGQVQTTNGVVTGYVDINWLDAAIQSYVTAPAANVFTQLLTSNVVLCTGSPVDPDPFTGNCGIGGYHSMTASATGKHTYAYNAWLNKLIFNDPTFANLAVMSHEVAEWAADPYVGNVTPNWISSIAPQYGCNNALEVGDPVVGKGMTIGGLFYQDEVYLNWFARRPTSNAWQGRRTWMNSFTGLSAVC